MNSLSQRQFILSLIALCCAYLGFEWWFNQYAMVTVDEFWFAHRIYAHHEALPYRDFSPYKTVLGYYLLLPFITSSQQIFPTLIFSKNMIALANAFVVFLASIRLSRLFTKESALCGVVVLLMMDTMLTYSTNIRVDLPAYWLSLFAVIMIMERQFIVAGILVGAAFAASQKAVWYLFACNAALGIHWLFDERTREYFLKIVGFNVIVALMITAYLSFWSYLSSWHSIYTNVFVEAAAMYKLAWYASSRFIFWQEILTFNPLTFLLWPFTLLALMVTFPQNQRYANCRFALVVGSCIVICLIPYKQVFPYYMQAVLPAFLMIYTAYFYWLNGMIRNQDELHFILPRSFVILYTLIYMVLLFLLIKVFNLPKVYLLLESIPILVLHLFLYRHRQLPSYSQLTIMITLLFVGIIYPSVLYMIKLTTLDGGYQKENITLLNQLLNTGGDYVAGVDFIYHKSQPIAGMKHLMGPAIDYLYYPAVELKPVMTAALDEDTSVTADSIIKAMQDSNVKIYVNNYRIAALPPSIKQFLDVNYQHYWGSIYIYAPVIPAGNHQVKLKFTGQYTIQTPASNTININHMTLKNGDKITLTALTVTSRANQPYRLVLNPGELQQKIDNQEDLWQRMVI